ncbi:PhnH protein [Caenispirillum salinarum AK4]|uniref:PhnH protein n=1 Tax=Caenispirillum salinarum AK4 TaxID=1238182 RepID=K9HKM0_9PROT|nr:phosphonate C-P lyase system protein PhnH [Caenispirillum salinarum]EKV30928.1 PhnH protein [Caenispirillum salinarum AK4]
MTAIPHASDLRPGFADPVLSGQAVYRAVLKGMSYPGRLQALPATVDAPPPLSPVAAGVLLALADLDAPVWLDPAGLATDDVAGWLRFHCGCPVVEDRATAAFAVLDATSAADLEGFALGTPEYPERSATLIIQVPRLAEGEGHTLTGPGIKGSTRLRAEGLPEGFWRALADNRLLFPQGLDVILAAPEGLACLPRTTIVSE